MPRDSGTECTRAAGDQDGAIGVGDGRGLTAGGSDQPRHEDDSVADCGFGLVGQGAELVVLAEVDQAEPAGVLLCGGAQQASGRRGGEVGDVLTGARGDGAAGDENQAGMSEPLVGDPALDQIEGTGDGITQLALSPL